MRILWHGIKPNAPTGYGGQTKLFVTALRKMGHDVAINCASDQLWNGRDGDGTIHFATGPRYGLAGNDYLPAHIAFWKPDCIISMIDTWVCEPTKFDRVPWFPWVMIDTRPMLWMIEEGLKACRFPIAPTRCCQKELQRWAEANEPRIDGAPVDKTPSYCPLVYDANVYYHRDKKLSRSHAAEIMGLPQETIADMFIVMVNAANMSQPSRKNFAAAIEAWSMFWRGLDAEWRDRAYLYLHTDRSGSIWNGEELNRHIKLFDAKNVLFPPQYQYIMGMIGTDRLSYLYNSADVLLCTSRGEGFGLPLIEAQACGVPVIAPDFDATAELAAKGTTIGGTLCSLKAGTQEIMVDTRKTAIALFGAWQRWRAMQCNCDTEDIQEIADWAYDNYSIQIVTEQFLQPLVNRIESNISQQEAPQKT